MDTMGPLGVDSFGSVSGVMFSWGSGVLSLGQHLKLFVVFITSFLSSFRKVSVVPMGGFWPEGECLLFDI